MVIHKKIKIETVEKYLWDLRSKICEFEKEEKLVELVPEIRKGLKLAKNYCFNKLHFEFAESLYYHYQIKERSTKMATYLRGEINNARHLRDIEEKARQGYTDISYQIQSTNRSNEDLLKALHGYCLEMEKFLSLRNTNISKFIFQILITKSKIDQDYKKALMYLEDAITFFESKGSSLSAHYKASSIDLLIISKEYKRAIDLIESSMITFSSNRFSKLVLTINKMITLIHAKRYEDFYFVLSNIKLDDKTNQVIKETFQLLKGFAMILGSSGLINNCKRFRISKILNELPIFTKDKYGNFINILILKLATGIQTSQDKLIDEYEGIERAFYRYCEKDSREYTFIKMLLRFPKYGYDLEVIKTHNISDFEKLKSLPLNPENIEVIPFEDLYDIMMKSIFF